MKKFALLALIVLLPMTANAYDLKDGDPGFIFPFANDGLTIQLIRGETWCEYLYAANFYWNSTTPCTDPTDTFATIASDVQGWPITATFLYPDAVAGGDAQDVCFLVSDVGDDGWWYDVVDFCITVPCEALVGDLNTLTCQMVYCDETMTSQPDSGDCVDPNSYGGDPAWSTLTQDFEVVESPPALYILQDTLYYVEQGQTAAYIPFSICNGDACAPPTDYDYIITSVGWVGGAINQTGTAVGVVGGVCEDVYGIVDAGITAICTYDTLTIVVWASDGSVYDTCVQAIHVVEPVPVPLFTAPVVTILVLAMILAAAVIMKRHAVSKA
jgi:hypothetical protein